MIRLSNRLAGAALVFSLSAIAVVNVGCANQTEGQKTEQQAEGMQNAAQMILRGEKNVADGKAEIARGQAMKDQNNDVEGDKLVAEGKSMQSLGEEQIAQGKKLRDKN